LGAIQFLLPGFSGILPKFLRILPGISTNQSLVGALAPRTPALPAIGLRYRGDFPT